MSSPQEVQSADSVGGLLQLGTKRMVNRLNGVEDNPVTTPVVSATKPVQQEAINPVAALAVPAPKAPSFDSVVDSALSQPVAPPKFAGPMGTKAETIMAVPKSRTSSTPIEDDSNNSDRESIF